jgi:AraC-like DNA-binding protein
MEEVFDAEVGKARGVLRRPPPAGKIRHSRRSASPELVPWIAHYWMVSWDLRGCEPHNPETVPHPNFQVVFEKDHSMVSGVFTNKFSRTLEGRSHVFGIKFNPGGFRPFLKVPASSLANRTVPVRRVFGKGKAVDVLEALLVSSAEENEMVEAANAFFRERMPAPDKTIALAGQIVGRIFQERDIKTVGDLVARTSIGKRSLQRIFNEYVGVSPKWVIRRYRLHELVERINSGEQLDWADLALELGYFDQAHLINDFRSIIGYSPTQYQSVIETNS